MKIWLNDDTYCDGTTWFFGVLTVVQIKWLAWRAGISYDQAKRMIAWKHKVDSNKKVKGGEVNG